MQRKIETLAVKGRNLEQIKLRIPTERKTGKQSERAGNRCERGVGERGRERERESGYRSYRSAAREAARAHPLQVA